jgi:acylphosphatase
MGENVRAHLIISGRVQGVYFRAETQSAAHMHGVNGWVRNKRDGTVEAVVEGDRAHVLSLIEWCRHGPPIARVEDVAVEWQDHEGAFDTFTIKY